MTFLGPCLYKTIKELAGSSYKSPRLLPRQRKPAGFIAIPEAVIRQICSLAAEPQIPAQLILPAPDCHWWSQRAPSICLTQPGRATGTDVTCPVLRNPQKKDFWAQAERWGAPFLTCSHAHHEWEPATTQVRFCIRGKENLGPSECTGNIQPPLRQLWLHTQIIHQSGEHSGAVRAAWNPCRNSPTASPGRGDCLETAGSSQRRENSPKSTPSYWPSLGARCQRKPSACSLCLPHLCLVPLLLEPGSSSSNSQQREESPCSPGHRGHQPGNGILPGILQGHSSSDKPWDVAVAMATLVLIGLRSRESPSTRSCSCPVGTQQLKESLEFIYLWMDSEKTQPFSWDFLATAYRWKQNIPGGVWRIHGMDGKVEKEEQEWHIWGSVCAAKCEFPGDLMAPTSSSGGTRGASSI